MTKLNAKGTLRLATSTSSPETAWSPPLMPGCLPKEMKGQYDQVCRNLYAEKLWHPDRLPLIISYLAAAHLVAKLTGSLNVDGVTDAEGKLNPAARALSNAVTTLAKAGACLGLTVVRSAPIVTEEPPVAGAAGSRWASAAKRGDDE